MENFQVSEYFAQDHRALDENFTKFQQNKWSNYPLAKEYFKRFKFGLQRHLVWEEEFLFPLFEQLTGLVDGPTFEMRQEHRQIEVAMEAVHKKVQKADPNSDTADQDLLGILKVHHDKEEKVLFPAIDKAASLEQLQLLRTKMDSLPPERYKVCCNQHVHF